jgi:hypothetical protein
MKYIFTLIVFLISASSVAQEVTTEAVPKNLHIYSTSGTFYFDHVAVGCSGYRYNLAPSHPSFDTIVSLLLAAQMAEKKVVVRFDGCHSNGQGKVVGVYLK